MFFICMSAVISILDVVLWWLNTSKARHMFKSRYPDLKIPSSHWADTAITYIKCILFIVCPGINLLYAWVMLFCSDELCEKTVEKVYNRCMKEGKA